MIVAVLAEEAQKMEILHKKTEAAVEFIWPDSVSSLLTVEADVYMDLKFERDHERTRRLASLLRKPVFVGAVTDTLQTIGINQFIRINSWPGMIARDTVEVAYNESQKGAVAEFSRISGWNFQQVPDIEGFVSARIIASIINEAYFALGEKVASRDSIDVAMKLGTGYPYGPFEWEMKIGAQNILNLLQCLHAVNSRYEIAPELTAQAARSTQSIS
jgi:3-hydroxybutyryl-CoA dehydrogenase